jgi:hypothetical protein
MFPKILIMAAASTALASAPLLAAPGGGQGPAGGAPGAAAGGNVGAGANLGGGPAGAALDARMNSMGPANASPTGIAHANPNSVLGTNATTTTRTNTSATMDRMFPGTKASTHVKSGSLTGLTTGMALTSNGADVGTVQQIRTSADGTVRVVVVQGTNGRMFAIPANKLTLSNGTLTTTARLNGVNGGTAFANPAVGVSQGPAHASATGIAHANSHSVLAGGTVTGGSLAGLTTGTAVQFNGNTVGTVSRIVTSADGTVRRVLVTGTNGQTYSLSPTTLTFSGGVLTTTSFRGG